MSLPNHNTKEGKNKKKNTLQKGKAAISGAKVNVVSKAMNRNPKLTGGSQRGS
ncbi:MAG: hypothetical protein WAU24_14515 [Chitinophagaceae bacterium]